MHYSFIHKLQVYNNMTSNFLSGNVRIREGNVGMGPTHMEPTTANKDHFKEERAFDSCSLIVIVTVI